jgi:hypothetical protein
MNLQNIEIRNEEIVIDDPKAFNTIGRDVVLEDCTVRCRVPAKGLSIRGKLVKTLIIAERELKGFPWLEASLFGCTLQGVFKENRFGTFRGSSGICKSCIFSDAVLDDCSFYGEFFDTHTYPKWPCFVILNPRDNLAEMQSQPKDDRLSIVVDSMEFLGEEANAITYNAKSLAKRTGLSADEIQVFFSQFSFVKL